MLRLTAVLVTLCVSVCAYGQSNPQPSSARTTFTEQKASVLQLLQAHATHIDSSVNTNGYAFTYHASDFTSGSARSADVTFSFDQTDGLIYTSSLTDSISSAEFEKFVGSSTNGTVIKKTQANGIIRYWFKDGNAYTSASYLPNHRFMLETFSTEPNVLK